MKINKFATFAVAVAVMAFGFVACNNDGNNEVQKIICSDDAKHFLQFMTAQERWDLDRELGAQANLLLMPMMKTQL